MNTPTAALPDDHFPPPPPAKRCRACGRLRSAREFWRNAESRDGLASRCKDCKRAAQGNRPRPFRGPNAHGDWRCSRCGAWKPRDDYRPRAHDAVHPICRTCERQDYHDYYRLVVKPNREARARCRERADRSYRARRDQRRTQAAAEVAWARTAIRDLLAQGWTPTALAAALGTSRGFVNRHRDGAAKSIKDRYALRLRRFVGQELARAKRERRDAA